MNRLDRLRAAAASTDGLRLVVAWAITRLGLMLTLSIPAEIQRTGDLGRYGAVADAILAGEQVRVWEYPIAALAVVVLPAVAAGTNADYVVAFVALATLLDFVTLVGVVAVGNTNSRNMRGAWLWTLGVPCLGVVSLTRLDMATCALVAIGVAFLTRNTSGMWVGMALSLGALVKAWPSVVLAAVLGSGGRQAKTTLAAAVATIALTLVIAAASGLWYLVPDFLSFQDDRGLQLESFAALPLLWLDRLGVTVYSSQFAFGSQQLVGPGSELVTAATSFASYAGIFLLAVGFAWIRRLNAVTTEQILLFAAAGVLVLLVTNKVFSPQYMLWLLVLYAVMSFSPTLVSQRAAAALLAATALTHAIFPYLYPRLVQHDFSALVVVTIRDLLLVYLLVDLLAKIRTVSRVELRARSSAARSVVESGRASREISDTDPGPREQDRPRI